MKASELKSKKGSELAKLLATKIKDLQDIRFGLSGVAKSTSSVKNTRKDIARIKTVMRENEMEAEAKKASKEAK